MPKLGPLILTIYQFDLEGRDTGSGFLRDRVLRGVFDSSGTRIDDAWDDGGGEGYNAPHLDQNVLGQLRLGSSGLDSGLLGSLLSPPPAWPGQRLLPYPAQTWHSKIEIRDEIRK